MKNRKVKARFSVWKRVVMTGLAISAVCSLGVGIAACKDKDSYKTADGKTEYTVEYGDWFYCPEINHESPEISVTDPNGKDVMVLDTRFKPQMHGEYVVTYTMGTDVFQIKVVCADTKAPEIDIKSITQNATVGDVVNIATYLFSDNSGVDTSKTTVSVEKDGAKVTISENEGVKSFVASEVGEYNITISYQDVVGNTGEYKYVCYCVDLSGLTSGDMIMSFDDEEFSKLISPAIGYENSANYSIAMSNLPELEDGSEATGGMLKIDIEEDSDVKLAFTSPKNLDIYNDVVEEIFVRVYSEEPTSKFRLYNEDGETLLINKAFMVGGWHTYSFDPRTAIGYYGSFKNFYIEVGAEDATAVYVDSIYYTQSWRDETLAENQIASYDSEEYLNLIKQSQYNVGAKYSFVNKEDVEDEKAKAGIDGGALKVVLNSSLQGFILQFSTPILASEIGTLDFKVYMDRRYNNSRWGLVTEKGEYTAASWGDSVAGFIGVSGWQTYSFAGSYVQSKIENMGASYVTGLYFAYYETAEFTATLYVDNMSYQPRASYEGFNEYDESLGGNSLVSFEDEHILNNMATAVNTDYAWYNVNYAIAENNGQKVLEITTAEPKSGNASRYIGTRYTFQERISILQGGKLAVGNFYVKVNMISGYAAVRINIGGVTKTFSVTEGENTMIIPARDVYSVGDVSVADVTVAVRGSDPKFQIVDIWYDSLKKVTPALSSIDEGTLISEFEGEEYTTFSTLTVYDNISYGTKATVAQYSDYEETNGTKLSLTDKSGVEYNFESFNLKRLNRRIGNEMMIDVYTTEDLNGTLYYGVIVGASYYTQSLRLTGKAEKVTLTMVMDDILESGATCAGVFFAYEGTAGDLYVDRMYYTPYAIFLETPAPTYVLSNGEATVNWAAVNGATEYEITYQDGTVETQTNCSLTVSTSQYIQIVARDDGGSYSVAGGVYVNTDFNKYDEESKTYMLATFDDAESVYAIGEEVKQSAQSTYTHPIVASELSYKDTHTTAGGMVGNGLLQVNTKAQPWASWGGFSYDFPVGVSTATVSKIGVKILYESLADSHYNAEYIGVVIDGKPYYAKGYMSYQKSSGATWAAEIKETSQWIGNAHTNAEAAIFYVDVEALLAANSDINASQITGVFVGMYQSRTYYVDSIFYTLPVLDAPTLTLTKGDTKTTASWTAVAGASGYEVTYPNGSTEIVTTTSVEFTPVSATMDTVKVRALGVSGVSLDSDYATQTIIYKTEAELNAIDLETLPEGAQLIQGFNSIESTSNVSNKVAASPKKGDPSWDNKPIVNSTLSFKDSLTSNSMTGTGLLQVNTSASKWVSWGGFTYNFPEEIDASKIGTLGVKVMYANSKDSQENYDYLGIIIDGVAYNAINYIYAQKASGAMWSSTPTKADGEGKGFSNLNADAALIYVDVEGFLAANPGINASQITGVFMGMYNKKTYYVDSIFYTLPVLDAPTLTLTKGDTKTTASWTAVAGASGYEVTYPDGSTEIVIPKTHIEDITVQTVVDGDYHKVKVEALPENVEKTYTIYDREGKVVATSQTGEFYIKEPRLWECKNAYLYTVQVQIEGDCYEEKFGIRKVSYDGNGLYLNDKKIYLKGFGKHEDFFISGKGNNTAVNVRDFELLKWIGANSFRTSHYPYCEEIMNLADEYGILVIDEVPCVGMHPFANAPSFTNSRGKVETIQLHKEYLTRLLQRDKNHPCVVMISLANEAATHELEAKEYFREVVAYARSLTKLPLTVVENVTPAMGSYATELVDFIALNRYYSWYDRHGQLDCIQIPLKEECFAWWSKYHKPIFLAEFGADTIEGNHALPSETFSEEYQCEFLQEYFDGMDEVPYLMGEHVWNFADFKTKEGLTRVKGNRKGIFTRERQPKSAAFLLKKRWAEKSDYIED